MKVSVIGTGYVGLTTAVGLASKGHQVIGVEKRKEQLDAIASGKCPFYEKGMDELLRKVLAEGKLGLTSDLPSAVDSTEVSFICVGTPQADDGRIDLSAIREVSGEMGRALAKKQAHHAIAIKSTVLPGTTVEVAGKIIEKESGKKAGRDFSLAMVPEFLREGSALSDFLEPDRIVIGAEDEKGRKLLTEIFTAGFSSPLVQVNTRTAELIKYANNSFLALCISFSNEIAEICEKAGGVDAYEVMDAVAKDGRITIYGKDGKPLSVPGIAKYLVPGCGFGGSCFPKDLSALSHFERELGMESSLVQRALSLNSERIGTVAKRAETILGPLSGKRVAVLGIAFKAETDDIRGSPSIGIISGLLGRGASVAAYDPMALERIRPQFKGTIEYSKSAAGALSGAELAIVVTAWKEFRQLSPEDFASKMKAPRLLDCRGIYDRKKYSQKLEYHRTGYRK